MGLYTWIYSHFIYTHTHKHIYPHNGMLFSLRKEENTAIVTTWLKLVYIILHKINHTQKDKYCMISFTCSILKIIIVIKAELVVTESEIVITKGSE